MNVIQRKTLRREDWPRILERAQAYMPIQRGSFSGMACLLHLKKAKAPLISSVFGEPMTILDNDYIWLQIAPENRHWWLSVMFTETGKLQQYYFDITRRNDVCGEDSSFEDLFLDVVVRADGEMILLDADELEDAFTHDQITLSDYELAWDAANNLMNALPARLPELEQFCHECVAQLKPMLK